MVKAVVLLVVVFVGGLLHLLTRRQRYALALRAQCMCCDAYEVSEREDLSYACRSCGFDSTWADDPTRSATVELMRTLTRARDDLQLGVNALTDSGIRNEDREAAVGNYEMSALSYLQEACDLDPTLIDDLEGLGPRDQLERIEESRATVRMLLVG